MEETTRELLREAALKALSDAEDRSAFELISLLNQEAVQVTTSNVANVLPSARDIFDAPAHDYHYWARFIRENFLPFMTGNGRLKFTSPELFSWLDNCSTLKLTTGDIETHSSGREAWRNSVSLALQDLKKQGVVNAPTFGRVYEINQPALMPASGMNFPHSGHSLASRTTL
jgi:hypothetical protein